MRVFRDRSQHHNYLAFYAVTHHKNSYRATGGNTTIGKMTTSSATASNMAPGANKTRKVGNNIVIPVPTATPYADADMREKQPLLMEEGGSRRHQFDTSVSLRAEYFPESGFMKELFSRDNRMVSQSYMVPLSGSSKPNPFPFVPISVLFR